VRWRGWDAYPILHVFAFGPRALRRLVERAGFDVVETANSALASPGSPRAGLAAAAVRALTRAGAGVVSALSGGRWLAGPSIEVYARRRDESRR